MTFIKKYITYIIIGIVIILSLLLNQKEEVIINKPVTNTDTEIIEYIYVDLKGEVILPGVYKITTTTRLYQLIEMAGGMTKDADPLKINLSVLLKDMDVVYVPSIYDIDIPLIDEETSELIDINQANKMLLTTLPGIGEATAEAIITYREEVGYFETIEEIMNVSGIGEATFNNIKDLITT